MFEVTSKGCNYRFDGTVTKDGVLTYKANNSYRLTWNDVRQGSNMPNWRQKIRMGSDATTNFSASNYTRERIPIARHMTLTGPSGPSSHTFEYWVFDDDLGAAAPNYPSSLSHISADLSAREGFLKKYRARRIAFQGGVFLGELGKTIQMLKNPAQALRKTIDAHRLKVKKELRGRYSKAQLLDVVQDSWLEAQYGWKPLINDCFDAMSLLSASPDRYRQPIKSEANEEFKASSPEQIVAAPAGVTWPYAIFRYNTKYKVGVIYKGACDARMMPPSFREQMGLSWSSVLPTVWELIPYSFLIDYFSNVGTVISGAATGTIGLSWGARMTKKESEVYLYTQAANSYMSNALGSNYKFNASVNGSGRTNHYKDFVRSAISQVSVGISDVRFDHPSAGSLKWLNIAALGLAKASDRTFISTHLRV